MENRVASKVPWLYASKSREVQPETLHALKTREPRLPLTVRRRIRPRFQVLVSTNFADDRVLDRELLSPAHPPGHLHHHEKRQNRANRDRQSRKSLQEKGV